MTTGWSPAQLGRVIGASHRRQGAPCQDAVLAERYLDREGDPLALMAVADGHGGSRYWRSDVGSRLACEQVAAAIRAELMERPLTDDGWESWLRDILPKVVQERWLTAIEAEWSLRDEADGTPFSPLTYGTTLGLVLMAPGWWAVGGIGDWDLLEVDSDGQAGLRSEEVDLGGGGEATGSLCLGDAANLWRQRCELVLIEPGTRPFSLLLSSDGLRKSCATDGDYRVLGAYLSGLDGTRPTAGEADDEPVDLEAALTRVTEQGSGDDVSVAIGRWNGSARPDLVGEGSSAAVPAGPFVPSPNKATPARAGVGVGALGIVLLVAAGVIALVRWPRPPEPGVAVGLPPHPAKETTSGAAGQRALQDTITELCGTDAARRRAILRTRRSQFERVGRSASERSILIAAAAQDPLGALIALRQPQPPGPTAEPGSLPAPTPAQPSVPTPASTSVPTPAQPLNSCRDLELELADQWRDHGAITPGPPLAPGGPGPQTLPASVR